MGMKTKQWIGAMVVLGWSAGLSCVAIEPGDTVEEMTQELGEPVGFIDIAGSQVYLYDRGRVSVEGGRVTAADLISAEELAIRREVEALERERLAEELREKRARRYQEGTELLTARLDDPDFTTAPAAQRLAYWKMFRVKYPEVSLPDDYEVALREREAELRAQRAEARVRELEDRAREAEQEAEEAALASAEAERRASSYRYGDYPTVSYGYPAVYYPVGCTCRRSGRNGCSLHRPETYRAKYVPYRSTPGYGYQRSISGRPFITTGRKAFVPRTRAEINGQNRDRDHGGDHDRSGIGVRTDGGDVSATIHTRF